MLPIIELPLDPIVTLALLPSGTPGAFRVWAFLDAHALQCITVHVPRIFFVNMRTPQVGGPIF